MIEVFEMTHGLYDEAVTNDFLDMRPSRTRGHDFNIHDDVIKWKHFPRNWPFVRKIHRSPVNFPHKGQWRGALMFSLIYAWINDWANNREAGDLRRYPVHYDVIVMFTSLVADWMSGSTLSESEWPASGMTCLTLLWMPTAWTVLRTA